MTVIAYREGILAADSQFTDENFQTTGKKLFRKRGKIIGFAGDAEQGLVFTDWYFNRRSRKPEFSSEKDWCALVLGKDGLEYWGPSLRPLEIDEKYYAIGSGAAVAMGAMDAGATALQAVRIACKRDPHCAPPVVSMSLTRKVKA